MAVLMLVCSLSPNLAFAAGSDHIGVYRALLQELYPDGGFLLIDLDQNGTDELIVCGEATVDIYTYRGGVVYWAVEAFRSFRRPDVYLVNDHYIVTEGSGTGGYSSCRYTSLNDLAPENILVEVLSDSPSNLDYHLRDLNGSPVDTVVGDYFLLLNPIDQEHTDGTAFVKTQRILDFHDVRGDKLNELLPFNGLSSYTLRDIRLPDDTYTPVQIPDFSSVIASDDKFGSSVRCNAFVANNDQYTFYADERGLMRLDRKSNTWDRVIDKVWEWQMVQLIHIDDTYLYYVILGNAAPPSEWPEDDIGVCELWRLDLQNDTCTQLIDYMLGTGVVTDAYIYYQPDPFTVLRCDKRLQNAETFLHSETLIWSGSYNGYLVADPYFFTFDGMPVSKEQVFGNDEDHIDLAQYANGKKYLLDQIGDDIFALKETDPFTGKIRTICTFNALGGASQYIAGDWAFFYDDIAGYGYHFNEFLGKCPLDSNDITLPATVLGNNALAYAEERRRSSGNRNVIEAQTPILDRSPEMLNNLDLCMTSVNGSRVMYGDTFSFLGVVGSTAKARGYMDAIDGRGVRTTGGGISHVASTLYSALWKMLFVVDITEKHHYSMFTGGYVDEHYAVAVEYDDGLDLRFKNDFEDMTIYMWRDDRTMYCQIITDRFANMPMDNVEGYDYSISDDVQDYETDYEADYETGDYEAEYEVPSYLRGGGVKPMYVANCESFVTLRKYAAKDSDALARVPYGSMVALLYDDWTNGFRAVHYDGVEGFILGEYLTSTQPPVRDFSADTNARSDNNTKSSNSRNASFDIPYFSYSGKSAVLNQKMATRTGPNTKYTEPGTFPQETAISVFYQTSGNGVQWGMVEFKANGEWYRAYTGMKRIDTGSVPKDSEKYQNLTITRSVTPLYGPGAKYAKQPATIPDGERVKVYFQQDGYAMIDYDGFSQSIRGWIPMDVLK